MQFFFWPICVVISWKKKAFAVSKRSRAEGLRSLKEKMTAKMQCKIESDLSQAFMHASRVWYFLSLKMSYSAFTCYWKITYGCPWWSFQNFCSLNWNLCALKNTSIVLCTPLEKMLKDICNRLWFYYFKLSITFLSWNRALGVS